MPAPAIVALANPALWQYLTAIGAAGTYAMNKDKIDNFAGSLRLPWGNKYMDEEAFLRGDIPSAYDRPTVTSVLQSDGTYSQEAAPGATDSEFDAKEIVYPAGALVHQPAGALVGGGGNGGNGGGDDDKFMSSARWTALGETPSVISRLFSKAENAKEKDYSEGYGTKLVRMEDGSVRRVPIETEIQGSDLISQDGVITDEVLAVDGDSVSDKVSEFLAKKDYVNSRRFRNSPAKRSGVFTDDQLWAQKKMNDDFQVYRDAGDLEGFARKYPMSQTAKKMRKNAPYGRPVDF